MCEINRRQLILSTSALLLYGCGDSEKYNESKDYYPVTQWSKGYIFHWGKNNKIKINSNSNSASFNSNQSHYINSFKSGVAKWDSTLSSLGISIEYVSSGADVNVKWLAGSSFSTGVLGYASTDKNISMSLNNNSVDSSSSYYYYSDNTLQLLACHEFGHMLGVWSHSYDVNDVMYPYLEGSDLSNRDKKTVSDFLYNLTPTQDMHDRTGPLIDPKSGKHIPDAYTYLTTSGCKITFG